VQGRASGSHLLRVRVRAKNLRVRAVPGPTTLALREYSALQISRASPRRTRRTRRLERASSAREARFEACRAITVSARPQLGAIRIATPAARVRVLHFQQIKILFPVGTLLGKRRRTVAHLDPLHTAVIELPRVGHVPEILIAGNRSFPEGSLVYGARQRICLSGFDTSRNKITHADDCTARGTSFARPFDGPGDHRSKPSPHGTTFIAETAELAETKTVFSAGSASSALIVVARAG
jgi:hypothetical protein